MGAIQCIFGSFLLAGLLSCSDKRIESREMEAFISRYDTVSFDQLRGISITQRSSNLTNVTYVIGKSEGNLPPYFVTFDTGKQTIIDINKINLERSGINDYLNAEQMRQAIGVLQKHHLFLLAVDSAQDVYTNPFYENEPPLLLRLKGFKGEPFVKKGFVYDLYAKNWYLNRSHKL